MSDVLGEPRPVVTLVLRIWPVGPTHQSEVLRLEATHVQTGEVAYFRTIAGVADHIERLIQVRTKPPLDLAEARRRNTIDE
jgi:hypothetical protein